MPFQDTRLYELCRWFFAGLLGVALALLCWFVMLPWDIETSHEYIGFPVLVLLGILLIFLSMCFALPTISLILAVWGGSLLSFMLSIVMPYSLVMRVGIYLLFTIMSSALWYYYCRKKAEKGRFIVAQVVATGALAYTLFLCAEVAEIKIFLLRHPTMTAQKLDASWFKSLMVHREVVSLVFISLCVLLAGLISCPMFIQFGLIFAAVFSVLHYEALGPPWAYVNLTISNIYIAFLVFFLCFRLYRQHRSCP